MQGDVNPANRRLGVAAEESQEWIKCSGRVCIQQRLAQTGLAHNSSRKGFLLVARIAKTQFPVPGFKVIAKFSQFTAKPDIEQRVLKCRLKRSHALIVDGTKPNPCCYRDRYSVDVQSRIRDRERIKWILDWHADAGRAERRAVRVFEWIRGKRSRCRGSIKK